MTELTEPVWQIRLEGGLSMGVTIAGFGPISPPLARHKRARVQKS